MFIFETMRKVLIIFFSLFLANAAIAQQDTIMFLDYSYQGKVKRKFDTSRKVYYKLKDEIRLKKHAGHIADVINGSVVIKRNGSAIEQLNYGSAAATFDTINWKDFKWIQVQRPALPSLLYDGLAFTSYGYTIGGIGLTALGSYVYHTTNTGGMAIVIGVFSTVLSTPTTILFSTFRFKEYKPEKYQIEVKKKNNTE